MVVDSSGVATAVADARRAGRVAVDAEFLWERTYAPIPCLIQMASDQAIWLIDPVAGAPLDEMARLMADPSVQKVMHAPGSDLALFAAHFGTVPAGIVDTQTTAGFVGQGTGASLATLLERVLSVKLAKTESYSDWSKRPLSPAQIEYGADDVRHLLALADEIDRQIAVHGREDWVSEEMTRRFGPTVNWLTDPEVAWKRVKSQGRLSGRERSALQGVAEWRERTARERDRPVQWILPDRSAIELSKRRPTTSTKLRQIRGVPEHLSPKDRDDLVGAIAAALERPAPSAIPVPPANLRERLEMLGGLGLALINARAGSVDVAASLVASRDELAQFLMAVLDGEAPTGELATGWRWTLVGEALTRLARSEISLTPIPEPPYLREIPVQPV